MNSSLSRWAFNCFDPTRVKLAVKTCKSGSMIYNTFLLKNCTFSAIPVRNIFTSNRVNVSFVYSITLKTGNLMGAGTDANVYVRMIGERGSTGEMMLKTIKGDMERGNINSYNFASDDVGHLKKIIIRHDNSGFAPGWYLDWVKVRDGRGKNYNFKCDQWLTKSEHNGNIKLLKEDNIVDDTFEPYVDDSEKGKEKFKDGPTRREINEERQLEIKRNSQQSQSNGIHHPSGELKTSPAVRNLIETYDIDLRNVKPSGRGSRVLKGDVLQYMHNENINRKKFVVNMWHAVSAKDTERDVSLDVPPNAELKKQTSIAEDVQRDTLQSAADASYLDQTIPLDKQLLNNELKMSKYEVPHLYMSTSCNVEKLLTMVEELEAMYSSAAMEIILVGILSRSIIETHSIISDNEIIDILVTHNGNSITLKNCSDAGFDNLFKQYENSFEPVDVLTLPRYGMNIIDTEGVSQLSSVLRFGQVISFNFSGIRLGIDRNGELVKSAVVAISCDSRFISDKVCGLLLHNCKNYLSNPNLLVL